MVGVTALVVAFLVVGYMLAASKKNSSSAQSAPISTSQEMRLEGFPTCLPHKNTSNFQTMECAFGISTKTGNYALDLQGLSPDNQIMVQTAVQIRVTGLVVPAEALSTDQWQKYDIEGIMRVDSAEKRS